MPGPDVPLGLSAGGAGVAAGVGVGAGVSAGVGSAEGVAAGDGAGLSPSPPGVGLTVGVSSPPGVGLAVGVAAGLSPAGLWEGLAAVLSDGVADGVAAGVGVGVGVLEGRVFPEFPELLEEPMLVTRSRSLRVMSSS